MPVSITYIYIRWRKRALLNLLKCYYKNVPITVQQTILRRGIMDQPPIIITLLRKEGEGG